MYVLSRPRGEEPAVLLGRQRAIKPRQRDDLVGIDGALANGDARRAEQGSERNLHVMVCLAPCCVAAQKACLGPKWATNGVSIFTM